MEKKRKTGLTGSSAKPSAGRAGPAPLSYVPRTDLEPWEKEIEADIARYFSVNRKVLIHEYLKRFENVIDRNNAQELYPPYAQKRESRQKLSLATHEPAGSLADEIYFAVVKRKCPATRNIVLFNAGGQGSGKTTTLRYSGKAKQAFIVMDGTLQDFDKSRRNIDLALQYGKLVHINFVYCPFGKAIQNIIRRASHPKGGRVVNVKRAARGHYQALENIFKIVDAYRDNPAVTYTVVDNSGDDPALIDLEKLQAFRYPGIDALEREGYAAVDDYFASSQAVDPSLTGELHQLLQGQPR